MSDYERLTKRGGVEKIEDFKEEYGYSSIYQRLSEIEDKIESGELTELPKKVFLGKNEIGENEYAVITTTSRLFCDEQQADDFLEKEKERMRRQDEK